MQYWPISGLNIFFELEEMVMLCGYKMSQFPMKKISMCLGPSH